MKLRAGLMCIVGIVFCFIGLFMRAQGVVNNTIVTNTNIVERQNISSVGVSSITYKIADGVKLTFMRPETEIGNVEGSFLNVTSRGYLEIGPIASTGTVVFEGNKGNNNGMLIVNNSGTTKLTNALFLSNTTTASSGGGTGIFNTGAAGVVELKNVIFNNNHNTVGSAAAIYSNNAGAKTYIYNSQFIGNKAFSHGGAIYVNSGSMHIENSLFKENYTYSTHVSGVMHINSANASVTLKNVDFIGNYARDNGIAGVGRAAGALFDMVGGSFIDNWAEQYAGALHMSQVVGVYNLTDVVATNNRAWLYGGFLAVNASFTTGRVTLTNVSINDNWAGQTAGAIYYSGNSTASEILINMTNSGSHFFTGNYVGKSPVSQTDASSVEQIRSGSSSFVHDASGGGFYYSTQNNIIRFNIEDGVTLTIGKTTEINDDSFASIDTAPGQLSTITKSGAGLLVLNADSSAWRGNVKVNEGTLLMGHTDAKLGGRITVENGAIFGGAGTMMTSSTYTTPLTSLTAKAGSIIQVGSGGATDKLTLDGTFSGSAGVTFLYDLFAGNQSGVFETNTFNMAGTGTIKLNTLASGTFTLITWTDTDIVDASSFDIIGGSGARVTTTGTVESNAYQLIMAVANSSSLAWTGNDGSIWQTGGELANWSGTTTGGAVTDFQNDDTVFFDATATNRTITIDAATVNVAGINVSGDADYTFNGGGIRSDGSLVKSGSGMLTFGNTSNNYGGIDISGGVIAFSSGSQLGGAASDINFLDNAALMANADGAVFANDIVIAAGKTATINTNDHALAHVGSITGLSGASALSKTGAGTLTLTGDSGAFAGTTLVAQGELLLADSAAKLGGAVMVAGGASAGGSGEFTGSVNIGTGAFLQVGYNSSIIGELAIASLALDGGTIAFDLFAGQTADKLNITALTSITGSNVIDIGRFQIGSHVIASGALSYGGISMDTFAVTIDGRDHTGARQTISLSIVGSDLIATGISDDSRALTWTGGGSSSTTWDSINANWTGEVSKFADGDRVTFDDTSSVATHAIDIAGSHMMVSDMIVSATADYSFTGGAIIADASSVQGGILTITTGKLVKDGAGTLTLANTATNDFKGGIDLRAGTLVFASTGASGTGAINITGDSATLRIGVADLTLGNTINFGSTAPVIDTQDYNVSLVGVLTGAGGFTKAGAGTLTLASVNSYTGATIIADGVLKGGVANAFANSGSVDLKDGATLDLGGYDQTVKNLGGEGGDVMLGTANLTVVSTANSTFNGSITGSGKLIKGGAAAFFLTGTNTFSGGVSIEAGTLSVNSAEALGPGNVAIGAYSTLEFRNVVSGTVGNELVGNLVNVVDSTLVLNGANILERLSVGSGGRLTVDGLSAHGGPATVISVANGGSLTIATPNSEAQGLSVETGGRLAFENAGGDPMLTLSGELVLEKNSTIALASIVTSGSSILVRAAGGVMDRGAGFDGGPNLDIIDFIIDHSGNVSVVSLNQAANPGKDIAAIYDAMTAGSSAIYSRLSENFLMSLDRMPSAPKKCLWLKGIGSYANYDSTPDKVGYKGDTYGVLAGYDNKISENLYIGAYLGCLVNKVTTDLRSESDGTLPHVGVYGAIRSGAVYVAGDIMYGSFDADTSRFEQTGYATGSFDASVFGASVELGTVLGVWEDGAIKPSVSVHYMKLSYRNQDETGPGAVSIYDFNDNRLEGLVSVQVTQGFNLPWKRPGLVDMYLGWRTALKDSPMKVRGYFPTEVRYNFLATSDKYNRSGITVGFGLRTVLTEKLSAALSYDYELGREFDRHTITATLRLQW